MTKFEPLDERLAWGNARRPSLQGLGEMLGYHYSRFSNFKVRTEWRPAAEIPGDPLGALLRSLVGRSWEHLLLGEMLADQIFRV